MRTCTLYSALLHYALLAAAALGSPSAWAQEVESDEPAFEMVEYPLDAGEPCGCAHCNRARLTGDWFGYRSCLQQAGVTFTGRSTHFAFGIQGGITNLPPVPLPLELGNTSKYTGRGEYDATFDLEKFGGMPHGKLLVRFEHWYGQFGNVSFNTGALTPAVFPAALPPAPNDPGTLYMTNFLLTQPLSEQLVVYAGKKDVLGGADQDIFAGGDGTTQFVNQAFIANPAFLLAMPYTGFTAGVVSPREWGRLSAFIYDPKNRTQDFFRLDDLFAEGVIVGGEARLKTNFLNMPGEHHIGGIWKHLDLTDLRFNEPPPGQYPYTAVPGFATISDSYTLYYGFDQYFQLFSENPERGWGMFGRAAVTDANPNPVRCFLSLGIGGHSELRSGHDDNWGIGWYFIGASNEFGPLPRALLDPQDGTGVELFYNFEVKPWLQITPDIQYIQPGSRAIAQEAFIYGIRVNMDL